MTGQITEQDALEAGVKLELLQTWYDLMQSLWTVAIESYQATEDSRLFPTQGDNVIRLAGGLTIEANMVNNAFVEAVVYTGVGYAERRDFLTIRFNGDHEAICCCVLLVVKNVLKYPPQTSIPK